MIMTVFIVEDDSIQSLLLKLMVEKLNLELAGVESCGKRAVEKIIDLKPDILLLDVMLKNSFDGISVAGEITKSYNPKIIYISGNSDNRNLQRAQEIGYHEFITKPVSLHRLKNCLPMAGNYR